MLYEIAKVAASTQQFFCCVLAEGRDQHMYIVPLTKIHCLTHVFCQTRDVYIGIQLNWEYIHIIIFWILDSEVRHNACVNTFSLNFNTLTLSYCILNKIVIIVDVNITNGHDIQRKFCLFTNSYINYISICLMN